MSHHTHALANAHSHKQTHTYNHTIHNTDAQTSTSSHAHKWFTQPHWYTHTNTMTHAHFVSSVITSQYKLVVTILSDKNELITKQNNRIMTHTHRLYLKGFYFLKLNYNNL